MSAGQVEFSLETAEALLEYGGSAGHMEEQLDAFLHSLFSTNSMADEASPAESQAETWQPLKPKVFRFLEPPKPLTSSTLWSSVAVNFVLAGIDEALDAATTRDAVIRIVEQYGLERVAKRVAYLSGLHAEDSDEPEVDLGSLKQMASVVINNPTLNDPRLTLTSQGYVHAEWPTTGGGRIAMTFLSSRLVDYAAISEAATPGSDIKRVNGRHFVPEAMNAVRWFASRIVRR